jgi:hypothetical protein
MANINILQVYKLLNNTAVHWRPAMLSVILARDVHIDRRKQTVATPAVNYSEKENKAKLVKIKESTFVSSVYKPSFRQYRDIWLAVLHRKTDSHVSGYMKDYLGGVEGQEAINDVKKHVNVYLDRFHSIENVYNLHLDVLECLIGDEKIESKDKRQILKFFVQVFEEWIVKKSAAESGARQHLAASLAHTGVKQRAFQMSLLYQDGFLFFKLNEMYEFKKSVDSLKADACRLFAALKNEDFKFQIMKEFNLDELSKFINYEPVIVFSLSFFLIANFFYLYRFE